MTDTPDTGIKYVAMSDSQGACSLHNRWFDDYDDAINYVCDTALNSGCVLFIHRVAKGEKK